MATGPGSALHTTYLKATSVTFLGIVLCQIGTAFGARTEHASLRDIGVFTNRPPLQGPFGTAALSIAEVAPLLTFSVIVWGVDELFRVRRRRRHGPLVPCVREERPYEPQGGGATLVS